MKTMEMIIVRIRDCAENEYTLRVEPDTSIEKLESLYYGQVGLKPGHGMLIADATGQSVVHDKQKPVGTLVLGKVREVELLFIPDTVNACHDGAV